MQTLSELAYITDLSHSLLRQLLNIYCITCLVGPMCVLWPINCIPFMILSWSPDPDTHRYCVCVCACVKDTISFVYLFVRFKDILFISNFILCSTSVLWVTCVTFGCVCVWGFYVLFSFYSSADWGLTGELTGSDNVRSVLITRPWKWKGVDCGLATFAFWLDENQSK